MYVGDVKDVKDRSNTPKGCNTMYVKDVKDRSNTPKGCNAIYVDRCRRWKINIHTTFWLITCYNTVEWIVKDGKRSFGQLTHFCFHNHSINILMDFQASVKKFWKAETSRAFQPYHHIHCVY